MDIKSLILIAGGVMIVAVILHGIYIAWRARRENLPMEIARDLIPEDFDEEARFRHELPNGGARVLPQLDGEYESPHDNGRSSPPMLLNSTGLNSTWLSSTGNVPRSGMTARPMSARAGVATRELPLEPSARETTRRNGSHTQSRQDIDDELFGSSDGLFTENRRSPTSAQPESRQEARTESKNNGAATNGGYARTNGSHAASPTPARVDPQPIEPQVVTAKAEAPALRPRVQNVTMPANAQPVQRRAAKESVLKERVMAQAPEPVTSSEEVDDDAVISIFLLARPGRTFSGQALYKALRAHGIKYGEMNIFHRVDPVSRVNLYSVANAVNPGTFDYSNLDVLQTPGVAFFMQLQGLDHPLRIFDDMRRVASGLASSLDGELKDENRSVIGLQTFDHYRERIAEYSRRRLSRPA